ncbi:glycosyltransferase [Desulfoferrobacter suflitae]|uniref:glycosyltransferase n=1 Tax=Desulfoferrobacter suflitae TaxID=2865782 RepID=UPI0021645443|nr:glycosyltransferase [Desulfoferrobacter suflitae]MCK8602048.1 glycosyltransferase [Desulfoferrobacter suflitae]
MTVKKLRIAVTGLAATYPFGGVFWDYLQYVLGLHRLGHQVLYIEDTGKWCYNPTTYTFVEDGTRNAALLAKNIERMERELRDRWFYRDATGKTYGRDWDSVKAFCREADLFLHISASCWMREEYFAAARVAFIDSDPMYTQSSVPDYLTGQISKEARSRVEKLLQHDVFFTFAENIGNADCLIPTGLFNWIPTRQPVVLDCFKDFIVPVSGRRPVLTTVASWEPSEKGPRVGDVQYYGKSTEFERYMELPAVSTLPIELAISGKAPLSRLHQNGWATIDAYQVSFDPWVYRHYLAHSFGEWSVAKNAYAASRSGWFSCRSACYLSLGVPVIVQDTGFGRVIPAGDGILTFNDMEQARDAIERLRNEPEKHATAALAMAREYFDANKVLAKLIERALDR